MGHEDSTMALTVYSGGLRIEPLVESINKLTYGEEVDSFIDDSNVEFEGFECEVCIEGVDFDSQRDLSWGTYPNESTMIGIGIVFLISINFLTLSPTT